MKAVAMRTPVPKCLDRKRNLCGMGSFGKRRAITGKEHAGGRQCLFTSMMDVLTQCTEEQNEEEGKDVGCSVVPALLRRAACWLLWRFILSSP